MKATVHTILLILSTLLLGCSSNKYNSTDWDKIKDSKNFAFFFNFAIETTNEQFIEKAIDSLEKYQPEDIYRFLRYQHYYDQNNDSLVKTQFYLEKPINRIMKVKDRNIVFISVDKHDSVRTYYQKSEYQGYSQIIHLLHDTVGDSYNLPIIEKVQFHNQKYNRRIVGVCIFAERHPDSLTSKTSWKKLIILTRDLLEDFSDIKDKKSLSIFNENYNELALEKKLLIDKLVPIFIDIYIDGSFELVKPPPPPPPPKKRQKFK